MIYLDLKPVEIKFTIDKLGVTTVGSPFLKPIKDEEGNDTKDTEVKQKLYYELSGPHPEIEGERLTPEKKNVDVDPMIGALLTKALLGIFTEEEKAIVNQVLKGFNQTFELKSEEVIIEDENSEEII